MEVMPDKIENKEKEKEEGLVEFTKALLVAGAIALIIRSFLFEPFSIPSGSMLPTLQVGDYLFVEKYRYGYSKYSLHLDIIPGLPDRIHGRLFGAPPTRGDIAVFRHPRHTEIDYIKRIVGLPGDKIQVKGGILHINGEPVTRDFQGSEPVRDGGGTMLYRRYIETLPGGLRHTIYEVSDDASLDNTDEYTIPPGFYFAMGDNRDNSLDSRVIDQVGLVPADNLVGRALFIFFSTEGIGDKCDAAKGLEAIPCFGIEAVKSIRFSRFLKNVNTL